MANQFEAVMTPQFASAISIFWKAFCGHDIIPEIRFLIHE
jgi:hypothetical protein